MKSILYSVYTGEYPNQSAGGPNNIIYKLIQNYNESEYLFDYLSSDIFSENLTPINLIELWNNLSTKKKTASLLSEKSSLYRQFCGSDFYLPYHFRKKNKYFKSFGQRNLNYDIIHSQDSISLSLIADKNTSSKKIMTVHSKGPLSDELVHNVSNMKLKARIQRKLKFHELTSVELADIIIFPSEAARKYYEGSLGLSLGDKKVRIIYNGVNISEIQSISSSKSIFEKYSISHHNNQLLILNVASHAPEKNIDILLEVLSIIVHKYNKNILLVNLGEGILTDGLMKLVKKLKIKDNVIFLGKIPNVDIIRLLKETDMFVMTSQKVIFDLVLLEALACGTCCVVSNDGGNKEIIKDCKNGYLINTKDLEQTARKIISVDKDCVKANALETVKQFSVQKMVRDYIEVYENLLNGV
jgi:1,2-diacylglycerol 3-alpha-glucosyltransferase